MFILEKQEFRSEHLFVDGGMTLFYFRKIMEIECPSDYDYAISENRVFCDPEIYRTPEIPMQRKRRKRVR